MENDVTEMVFCRRILLQTDMAVEILTTLRAELKQWALVRNFEEFLLSKIKEIKPLQLRMYVYVPFTLVLFDIV